MRKSHYSLHGLLRRSLLRSVVCMILPVCVLAGLLVVLTQRYGADIALTTRASEVERGFRPHFLRGWTAADADRQRSVGTERYAGQCRRGLGTVPQRGAARHPHDRQLR